MRNIPSSFGNLWLFNCRIWEIVHHFWRFPAVSLWSDQKTFEHYRPFWNNDATVEKAWWIESGSKWSWSYYSKRRVYRFWRSWHKKDGTMQPKWRFNSMYECRPRTLRLWVLPGNDACPWKLLFQINSAFPFKVPTNRDFTVIDCVWHFQPHLGVHLFER